MKPKNTELIKKYIAAHQRAIIALDKIEIKIHDFTAPDAESLKWSDLGDLEHIAEQLEAIAGKDE